MGLCLKNIESRSTTVRGGVAQNRSNDLCVTDPRTHLPVGSHNFYSTTLCQYFKYLTGGVQCKVVTKLSALTYTNIWHTKYQSTLQKHVTSVTWQKITSQRMASSMMNSTLE